MVRKNGGSPWRVAQDCSRIYGGGLAFCAIDRLDDEDYAQSVAKISAPPPSMGARGVHTLIALVRWRFDLDSSAARSRTKLQGEGLCFVIWPASAPTA